MTEPKKFSFGFSKVAKKPALLTPKPVETVEYIKCLEDKAVKLVNEEVVKPKELPIIPMPPGSSVRDRILDAIKAREEAKSSKYGSKSNGDTTIVTSNGDGSEAKSKSGSEKDMDVGDAPKPLTLDEMAAKELLENTGVDGEEKKETPVISTGLESATSKQSSLDDYENMPIGDFGLAMLRGMGWEPAKGIGLNEKLVAPVAPQVRPKGMGLGADKALAAQKLPGKATEELVMKKGSLIKVITGPHVHLYGKIEGFEELPGRILVRLTLSNTVVSMSEFMVQLVGPTEYNKNSKVMNLDRYNAALEPETKPTLADIDVKTEPTYRDSSKPPIRRDKERRSRSPPENYSERSSSRKSKKNRDRSRDRDDSKKDKHKKRDSCESDGRKYRKRDSPDRRHKRSNKKSKYKSSGSSSESDFREKKRTDKGRHKVSKSRKYKSDSDSSIDKHYKKHKKSRK